MHKRTGMIAAALVVALAGVLLAACGGGVTIQAGQQDSGGTVQAAAGDTIDLTLPENPSTGYSWTLEVSDGLSIVDDAYAEGEDSGGMVGVPGTHTWAIEVTGAGEQTIKGEYRQAQNPDDNPEYFTLTVKVE